ncbi:NTP transferase domain-containing protein [Oceanicella actignis]|uniref:Molybdenum cofactor cytidylyltransferase n=1 Tax=Oceanicella actignis TaxID=1189325 RepID=A0A1M7TPL3_9RHOB|nr:molybdenum cofactor cytidylyltransferase [Oceanicella actignis]SHN72573.1 molybdenum cofactor cytidylyltransferase [Oceanicella actignis]
MQFGPIPLDQARGCILAHSMNVGGRRLRKGAPLSDDDLAALRAAGHERVVAARLGPEDMPEDAAAARVAAALAPNPTAAGLSVSAPFTGRANLYALTGGVLRVDAARIHALNAVHESVTVATLPDMTRVEPRQMVATVKIIPYAAPRAAVEAACAALGGGGALRLHPPRIGSASLILTRTPGMKESLIGKGAEAVRRRLAALGVSELEVTSVPHEVAPLAEALRAARGELALILGGSATSDRRDVGPAAVEAVGGEIERFGMPVDPGNLLFLARLADGRPALGLPGCVRAPALNGADWVLERLVCAVPIGAEDIARMGVGGLLKEIPSRPQPRAGGARAAARPVVSAVVLAAGAGRRMGGRDKLLERVGAEPLLRRIVRAMLDSDADETIVVLRPEDEARRKALEGLDVRIVENPVAAEGMASSIRAGLRALRPDADAVALALADMPEIGPAHMNALIAAFDPDEGRAIVRAADEDGRPGHPVLFGRRFFESLSRLTGDEGAREVLRENADFVLAVRTPGHGARIDLDTPEAWAAWRADAAPPLAGG